MSFQSSILNMIHTAAAGLKAAEFVKSEKAAQPKEPKQPTAPQTMQPTAEKPAKVKEEPVFIGGQQVSEEIAAKVRAAAQKREQAEAALVVAQTEKRAKKAEEYPYISSLTGGYAEKVKEAKK